MSYYRSRPTIYNGIQMRSRLEASFAASLDQIPCTWTYEAKCFANRDGQYLPDFTVNNGMVTEYYEVKPPSADFAAALKSMHIIRTSEIGARLYVMAPMGNYPNQVFGIAGQCDTEHPCAECAPWRHRRTIAGRARRMTPE